MRLVCPGTIVTCVLLSVCTFPVAQGANPEAVSIYFREVLAAAESVDVEGMSPSDEEEERLIEMVAAMGDMVEIVDTLSRFTYLTILRVHDAGKNLYYQRQYLALVSERGEVEAEIAKAGEALAAITREMKSNVFQENLVPLLALVKEYEALAIGSNRRLSGHVDNILFRQIGDKVFESLAPIDSLRDPMELKRIYDRLREYVDSSMERYALKNVSASTVHAVLKNVYAVLKSRAAKVSVNGSPIGGKRLNMKSRIELLEARLAAVTAQLKIFSRQESEMHLSVVVSSDTTSVIDPPPPTWSPFVSSPEVDSSDEMIFTPKCAGLLVKLRGWSNSLHRAVRAEGEETSFKKVNSMLFCDLGNQMLAIVKNPDLSDDETMRELVVFAESLPVQYADKGVTWQTVAALAGNLTLYLRRGKCTQGKL